MVYQWSKGTRAPAGLGSAGPQVVGEALERVEVQQGVLTPEAVADDVEEAFVRGEEHPLTPWFTFDPELAFHKLHVIEARSVISSISVVRPEARDRRPVRAYVSIKNDGRPEYRRIDHVVQDRDMRQQLLVEVQEEQQRAQDKFAELLELVRLADEAVRGD